MTNTSTPTPLSVFCIASYNVVDHHVTSDDGTIFISPKEAIKVLLDSGKVCEGSIIEFRLSSSEPSQCEVVADNGVHIANLVKAKYGWGIDTSDEGCPECDDIGSPTTEGCHNCGLVDWDNIPL